ncbi:MAG: SPOR domain-containing protein [Sphingomonadaceae bacterium]|nr:SPOR domain-containing protein [Sphingomonadaceae bacterium]
MVDSAQMARVANGPSADYPMVLGDAFVVDGQEFVPVDTASYDAVGYAGVEAEGGQGITISHKTLPLPSYVEVTELDSGRTILARVERRGPMTTKRLVALSPGAQAALGVSEGAPVRVRRVNPPEADRAELRAGRSASQRMDTPKSLLGVLQRKLPAGGAATMLAQGPTRTMPTPVPEQAQVAPQPAPKANGSGLFVEERKANTAYPLGGQSRTGVAPVTPAVRTAAAPVRAPAEAATAPAPATGGEFVIQAAAFSSKANADRAASRIGGFVTKAGEVYRVRTGPYATRGQAEAALAKVREAGYSDARVFSAG